MDYQEYGIGARKVSVPVQLSMASNLDYNTPIMVEDVQVGRIDCYADPLNGVTESGPYTFNIPAAGETFLLMNTMTLYCKAKVIRENGTNLVAADVCAPINALGITMWDQASKLIKICLYHFILKFN